METLSGCDHDENDCHDEDKSWLIVYFSKMWNELVRGKFLKGVKETLIQPSVTKFLHDELLEWQKFQNGALIWYEKRFWSLMAVCKYWL